MQLMLTEHQTNVTKKKFTEAYPYWITKYPSKKKKTEFLKQSETNWKITYKGKLIRITLGSST